jgi:uncharacterized glyoxalase superfamily metalloenzyme YdcJ
MAVEPHELRSRFSTSMSEMYRREVPQYGTLLEIVTQVNERELNHGASQGSNPLAWIDQQRLNVERHGAIRVGTDLELATIGKIFAIMGMFPVAYYDLSVAGIPVHSTAFRPVDSIELGKNPFRVFTSLLRLDLVEPESLRVEAQAILASRRIFTPKCLALLAQHERSGCFDDTDANEFICEVLETFRWHRDATVDAATYERLNQAHRLIADIVSFKGPHINHLTPRTLNIDAAQTEMKRRGLAAKESIEGPPRRECPILLRQTSFKALEESIYFVNDRTAGIHTGQSGEGTPFPGKHTARFGEIEQRGIALTRKGRALYDRLLNEAQMLQSENKQGYDTALSNAFRSFPDDYNELRRQGLAYFRYCASRSSAGLDEPLERLLAKGQVWAEPIIYEDFLPVSAAGIFRSNLSDGAAVIGGPHNARASFERSLGRAVLDEFELYERIQEGSLNELKKDIRKSELKSSKRT